MDVQQKSGNLEVGYSSQAGADGTQCHVSTFHPSHGASESSWKQAWILGGLGCSVIQRVRQLGCDTERCKQVPRNGGTKHELGSKMSLKTGRSKAYAHMHRRVCTRQWASRTGYVGLVELKCSSDATRPLRSGCGALFAWLADMGYERAQGSRQEGC